MTENAEAEARWGKKLKSIQYIHIPTQKYLIFFFPLNKHCI